MTGYETQPTWQAIAPPPPRRSGWVTTAAVLLLAMGALSALFGLIFLIMGLAFGSAWTDLMSGQPGMPADVDLDALSGMMTGFLVAFAIIGLVWAAAHVATGVGVLGGRGWARITGLVLSLIGLAFSLLGLVGTFASIGAASAMMDDPDFRAQYGGYSPEELMAATILTGLLFFVPLVVSYVIILVALIRNGAFFDRPATATPPPAP